MNEFEFDIKAFRAAGTINNGEVLVNRYGENQ